MNLRRALLRMFRAQPVDLAGRRIIVTGASEQSLGFAIARGLAAWGADVTVSTRRDAEAAAAAIRAALPPGATGAVRGCELDLCDRASVARFAERYAQHSDGRLDVLVNCAGVHLDLRSQWRAPRLTADGHEIHWRTNYLGTMQLTQALLPLLLATAATPGGARIVNVASQLHTRGRNADLLRPLQPYDSWTAYGLSKLALVHASFELQRRHGAAGLQVYSLHPGAVFTRIADKGLEESPWLSRLRARLAPVERFFLLTPEEGAQTALHCATQPSARGGGYYRNGRAVPPSAEAADRAVAERLWQQTQEWLASATA